MHRKRGRHRRGMVCGRTEEVKAKGMALLYVTLKV